MKKAAGIIVKHSLKLKEGESVEITTFPGGIPFAEEIAYQATGVGAHPIIILSTENLTKRILNDRSIKYLKTYSKARYSFAKALDASVSIYSMDDPHYLSSTDKIKVSARSTGTKKIRDALNKKRWCIVNYPTRKMAEYAKMPFGKYSEFSWKSICLDWAKLNKTCKRIKDKMSRGKHIRIIGRNTDLSFDIRAKTWSDINGDKNLPDGEIFVTPMEDTTEGKVFFDVPDYRYGAEVRDVTFEFKKGKLVDFKARKGEKELRKILKNSSGRWDRLGEFGIGINRMITRPVGEILFDEKIMGTIHLALGDNISFGGRNDSSIHWDFIKWMRDGKVELDGKVIYKDGWFTIP